MRLLDTRLVRRSASARSFLAVCVILALLSAAAIIAQAVLLAEVIDRAFLGDAGLAEVAAPLFVLVLVALVRGALAWALEAGGHRAAAATILELRRGVARRLVLDRPGDARTPTGTAAAAAVQGVDALDPYFARFLPALALGAIVPVAIVIAVATIDWLSALVMLVTIPLIPTFAVLIGLAADHHARARYAALGRLSSHFLDVARGLTMLRAFNRGPEQADRLAESGEAYRRVTMGTLRIAFLSALVLELAAALSVAVIAVEIGVRLVYGSIAFAPALAVLILAPELYQPLRNAAAQFHASTDGLAAADAILDALDDDPAPRGLLAAPSPADGCVRLERVCFAYAGRPAAVLDDLSLAIAPGERVALVGPSGAGKSTIARLLLGFEQPSAGRITVADCDLTDLDPDSWRRRVGWLPQRPHLTTGTIAEAIALGRPDAASALVEQAARRAGADDFIRALPEGYATRVGDGGATLSAGQVRRIALARALLVDAPLLVLDEPTTSLDADSAAIVAERIAELPPDRSLLLITHDRALAERAATRIVTLTPLTQPEGRR